MKELLRTPGFTGKDIFNSAAALKLSDMEGQTISVADLYIVEKPDKDGKLTVSACLKATDSTVYATISQSIIGQLDGLKEMLPCNIKVVAKKSNAGKTYFMLELV